VSDDDLATPPPQAEHGGLNHLDFGKPKISWAIRKSISMLPHGRRIRLYVAAVFQVLLGFLDLLGIALIGLVAAVAVSGIGASNVPAPAKKVLDFLGLGDLTISQVSVVIALSAVVVLVTKTSLSAIMTRRIMRFLANCQAELSISLASRFLKRPLSDVQRWTSSEAVYSLGGGVAAATGSLLGATITIASEMFLFTIIGISLLAYDPLVTIISGVVFGGIVILLQRVLGDWSARNADVMKNTSIETLSAVQEALGTYREATVLNRRDLYIDRYAEVVNRYARASANSAFIVEVPKYVLEASLYLAVLVLATVQFLTKNWGAAASTTALFLAAGSRVIPSLLRLQGAAITVRNASVMAQPTFYMYDYLNHDPQSTSNAGNDRIQVHELHQAIVSGYPDFVADVKVRDVVVMFDDAFDPTLDGINIDVPARTSMALVGSTGAGKSTLSDVILGVLAPTVGSVEISGLSPREAINKWPGAITYVPQNVTLVPGTVRQNVAMGLPAELIDDDLVWEALRRAHIDDYLVDERMGLETQTGERGFKLSGGQRQRLGIARALYTRPHLLVLDEATSALDAETENAIIETLRELEGQVTTITVAHRLATVRHADQLIYLEQGRVTARGSFDEVRNQSADFDKQARLLGL
jgi:ABC-type bacteriocin/lantibiotic exporter with double-glycine peptidase domain